MCMVLVCTFFMVFGLYSSQNALISIFLLLKGILHISSKEYIFYIIVFTRFMFLAEVLHHVCARRRLWRKYYTMFVPEDNFVWRSQ